MKAHAVIAHNFEGTARDAIVGFAGTHADADKIREDYYTSSQPEQPADIIEIDGDNFFTFYEPCGHLVSGFRGPTKSKYPPRKRKRPRSKT